MNLVILVGRMTHDPEMGKGNKPRCSFQIATNEFRGGNKESEMHRCVSWDKTAEMLVKYGAKGRLVELHGRLQTREYEDRSGNKAKSTEVVVNSLNFLDKPPERVIESSSRSTRDDRDWEDDPKSFDIPF